MRNAIPNFTTLIRPIHELMEKVYARSGQRTKRSITRINLSDLGWNQDHLDTFDKCKSALQHQVTLAHYDDTKRICVYTDASDICWSGIVTQIPPENINLDHKDQRHQPLAFLSGNFVNAERRWSTLEKEAFAIMATVDRMHWILCTSQGFDLYTDHNNPIFILNPLSVIPDLSLPTLRKGLRWAVKLSLYSYVCIHITGIDNVWADLLGRWAVPKVIRRLVRIPELPSSTTSDFDWPSSNEIHHAQSQHANTRPRNLHISDQLWTTKAGAIWIPDECVDLQLRLCIIAHTGPSGHPGAKTTADTLASTYHWSTLHEDFKTFVRVCIHCLSTTGGEKVPRPFGPSFHGTAPHDLLQFDYIELGESSSGEKYVLMLRDDHSDFKWFFPCMETTAETAAQAIIDWCSSFAVPKALMSDGPTHFKNETIRLVCKGLQVPHHFTRPYCPWSNGAVERLGKELLRTLRALLSELQMRPTEWTNLIPIVQSVLNHAPSPQRGNVAPITAFTGLEPTPPVKTFIRTATSTPLTITDIQLEKSVNIHELQKRVEELHPIVQTNLDNNRKVKREAQSKGKLANFEEGDFVLVAREDFHKGEKLALRWRGPRRIVKALNDYVFQVEDLRNGTIQDIHGSRLKYYKDSSLNENAIMSHVLSSETGMPINRLVRFVETDDGLKVHVRWKGLPDSEDTFEPLSNVYEDVPQLLMQLLKRKNTPIELAAKVRRELRL